MTEELMYGICAGCILLCMAVCLAAGLYYRRELKRFSKALQTYEQTGTLGEEDCKEEMESKLLGQLCRVLRRSSLEREKAGKEKGEIAALLSDLSHQLKTPLANILMNTEILKEEKLTKKEQEMFLERNQEQAEKMSDIRGEVRDINFGNQIRSYVMQPYTLVKDHRTNTEVSNVNGVMDGNIDPFINAYLSAGTGQSDEA